MVTAQTVCAHPGCPRRVPKGRCKDHQLLARRSPSSRVTATRRWAKVRRRVLARDRHTCQLCGSPATEVDHITPVAAGGAWYELSNLRAVCAPCNQARNGS